MIRAIVRKWEGYFYLFPAVLFMLALIGYPLIYNMILSFQNVSLANIAYTISALSESKIISGLPRIKYFGHL